MDSTGEILRRARNERHLTLDEVAVRTRINRKYLAAIESGDSAAIPGGFFYKSFVRQYAAALSTDDNNVAERVEQSLAAENPPALPPPDDEVLKALAIKAEENAGVSIPANRSATTYALLLVLAIAGTTGIYMLWHRAQQAQASGEVARSTPHPPRKEVARQTPPPAAQPPSPAQKQPQPQNHAESQEPARPEPSKPAAPPPASAEPSSPAPAPATGAPASPAPNTAAQNPPPGPDDKIAINVAAKDTTWVSVSADGKTLFSGVMAPGQSRTFAARDNARMRVGNAAGIDVMFNGSPTGPLGTSGQPVTLLFTPSNFEIAKPKPPDQPAQPPPQPLP